MDILANLAYRLVIVGVILMLAPILALLVSTTFLVGILLMIFYALTKPVVDMPEDGYYMSWSKGYYNE